MNRRPSGLTLSKAILGFLQFKTAENLSPNTIVTYEHDLKVWLNHVGDRRIDLITTPQLREHLAWLRTDYKPNRFSGSPHPLSPKSIRNAWATLSSFFTWGCTEFAFDNPMKAVPAPHYEEPPVEPFSKEEVEILLKACEFCKEAQTETRRKFSMRRATGRRDRAIILTLLDTGLRASELCALSIGDIDQKTGRVQVKHGLRGGAKGGKGRIVYLGKAARAALWRYLAEREDADNPTAALFLTKNARPINKTSLRELITSLGEKTNVKKCYPHKFRHTFAITYLRSGGDVFTLQALLGHSSLEMVQHYARVAEIDIEQAHRRASPADNWHL
ncbi:MAG: hypothetical protein FJ009_21255 [Chloroflexi bacterium]|nr:hypothetical protein [Chloroflexota bacterium]